MLSTLRVPSPKAPAKAVQPPQTSVIPQPQNNGAPELVSSRGRKRKQTVPPPNIPAKVARGKNLPIIISKRGGELKIY